MSVIPITIFFSLLLAGIFVWLFAREQRRQRFASTERDSLLPLADETPRLVGTSNNPTEGPVGASLLETAHVLSREQARSHTQSVAERDHAPDDARAHAHDDHAHAHHHGKGACGCKNGERPPCTGCLRRTGVGPLTSASPLN